MPTRIRALAALVLLFAAFPAAAEIAVTRPVNVTAVTADSATIVWHTATPTTDCVEYGPTLAYGMSAETKVPTLEHAVTLHRLVPGQLYYYRVRCDGETLSEGPDYRFRSLPDKRTTRCRFIAFGDGGRGNATQLSLVPGLVAAEADFALHTGDVVYPLGEAEDFDPKHFFPYAPLLRNTPLWLSLGNHDYGTNDGQPYLDAFFLPRNNPAGTERYYSFDWGQVHVVILDSIAFDDPAQLAWLEADLAAATTTWKFAVFHHPLYSCGMHGSSTSVRNRFAPILEAHGVDIVLNGHDHDYQRSFPMRDGVAYDVAQSPHFLRPQGIVYIVTGGGAGVRPTSSSCEFTAVAVSATHFTQVDVDGTFLHLRAIDTAGQMLDEMTIDKSPAPDSSAAAPALAAWLLPNVPNPFNPSTWLRYELSTPQQVHLAIYDLMGRRVRQLTQGAQPAGPHQVFWDGSDDRGTGVGSGIYLVRLQASEARTTRKILLAK